ncbi:MAG: hypothetical protein JNL05_15845 [Flavobacteriales bacterium]|nr:hypothetical protein [Flavobacteriales bacterium]
MKKQLLFALMTGAVLTACKKDDPATPAADPSATIKVSYTFVNGTQPFTLDSTVTDSLGRKVRFSVARFLTSSYHMKDDAHTVIGDYHDRYILADAAVASNLYTLGTITPQHTHSLELQIGLDSAVNHSDPTQYTTAPLNDATMHWSWNPAAGYKFLALEGRVDANGDGVVDANDPEFTYHCATDGLRTPAEVHAHNDLSNGETFTVAITVDMGALLQGVDVAGNLMAMGATPVNQRLVQNLALALDAD